MKKRKQIKYLRARIAALNHAIALLVFIEQMRERATAKPAPEAEKAPAP